VRTLNITDVIKRINDMPDGLNKISEDNHPSENDDLDNKYQDSKKKHRNWIFSLDHFFEIITHPFSLLLFFLIILLVFLVFRYLEIGLDCPSKIPGQIHQDLKIALSYIATIIITTVFTKFLEKRKGNFDR